MAAFCHTLHKYKMGWVQAWWLPSCRVQQLFNTQLKLGNKDSDKDFVNVKLHNWPIDYYGKPLREWLFYK